MPYDYNKIEKKWQKEWQERETYKTSDNTEKPKFYVLDMFPYPSGAGLHVGHPTGYIASDICARFKRHQGFNVLHPMGYDSFGLPAEQYAIQTGQHPKITTEENITRYEQQMKRIGFSFDWSREICTSDSSYYKFTQWIFVQFFESWYNQIADKAESVETLIQHFEKNGTKGLDAAQNENLHFTAEEWNIASELDKQKILLNYRLAYRAETIVNWCPALGTVLANDEVINGKSERGGHPVYQKKMLQWNMRITAYSERLLKGLASLDWPQPLKDAQEYWIGKSKGASLEFRIENSEKTIEVFTTRPDTVFGSTFMVLAPENPLVEVLTQENQKQEIDNYKEQTSLKSERDRMVDVKTVSGVFTGSYALNPFTGKKMPIYISDYVLMGYGTGAVMAVPAHDDRDHRFAKKFELEIVEVLKGGKDIQTEAYAGKEGGYVNSDLLNGLQYEEAKEKIIAEIVSRNIGRETINYKQRDAIFSRQRYWGEPTPIYYKNGMPYTLPASALPLELPEVEKYLPTEDGDPPLGNAKYFAWDEENAKVVATELIDNKTIFPLELSTMPGWAGSSWYSLRYMDPKNSEVFVSKEKADYWKQVDLYVGGNEHATGHLLYARFWNMFLKDRGYINFEEPFKKLINQGMILGMSALTKRYLINKKHILFISSNLISSNSSSDDLTKIDLEDGKEISEYKGEKITQIDIQQVRIDLSLIDETNNNLNIDKLRLHPLYQDYKDVEFVADKNGDFKVFREVEKMSKSYYNVVNPDSICEEYGADCLRLYEMFLGPLEQPKPWNTQGLSGVSGFLKKFWNLYFKEEKLNISEEEPTKEEYKILHTLIKKVIFDIEHFSFNTSVSSFMIAVNELSKFQCNKRKILEPLAIVISPYAPHICEELWEQLGHDGTIEYEPFPTFNPEYLVESEVEYPVSFNGKTRFKISLPADFDNQSVEKAVLNDERSNQYLAGKTPKKIIVVPKKIVNIVI